MGNEIVMRQIEDLRHEMNTLYRLHSAITPELVELSTRLDVLLNKLHRSLN